MKQRAVESLTKYTSEATVKDMMHRSEIAGEFLADIMRGARATMTGKSSGVAQQCQKRPTIVSKETYYVRTHDRQVFWLYW